MRSGIGSQHGSIGPSRRAAQAALLRGRLARLFADRGKAAREDPRGTYAQSRPVTRLDFFCSHSWACPQTFKYLALLCHFNLKDAVAATAVFHSIAFALELALSEARFDKSISIAQQRPTDLHPCDGCHTPLWCSTFEPDGLHPRCSPATVNHFRKTTSLFLDICCIAQGDEEAKAVEMDCLDWRHPRPLAAHARARLGRLLPATLVRL